jgi:hypothetical protein
MHHAITYEIAHHQVQYTTPATTYKMATTSIKTSLRVIAR